MIIVKIVLHTLPEKRLELTQTLLSLSEPTVKTKGCLTYSLLCDVEDKNCLNLYEEWETREDLDKHIISNQFRVLLGSKPLLIKPLEIKFYTVHKTKIYSHNNQ